MGLQWPEKSGQNRKKVNLEGNVWKDKEQLYSTVNKFRRKLMRTPKYTKYKMERN